MSLAQVLDQVTREKEEANIVSPEYRKMVELTFNTIEDLQDYLMSFGEDVLFRGQTQHYTLADGQVSISTSHRRQGCVPQLLRKWSHYAEDILRGMAMMPLTSIDSDFIQAFLQHYGWRSFFVDLTSDFAVATWFASHKFTSKMNLMPSEDCFEQFVVTAHQVAKYEVAPGEGSVYVVSKEEIEKTDANCIDLTRMKADFTTRFITQKACLAGPFSDGLPPESVLAHIRCPAVLFSELAKRHGYTETSTLFPSREKDAYLERLLSVPYQRISAEVTGYARGLMLPEYDFRNVRAHSPSTAFFTPFWIADNRGPSNGPLQRSVFFRISDHALYNSIKDDGLCLPNVTTMTKKYGSLVVEADGILRFPEFYTSTCYGKGVYVENVSEDLFQVHALNLEHPGSVVEGAGFNYGWYYKFHNDGNWQRHRRVGECPCINTFRHLHHTGVLHALECMLANDEFRHKSDLDFVHSSLSIE